VKIRVRVKVNSKIEGVNQEGDNFIVRVKEAPREGRANQAIIKSLAKHFEVSKSQVRILSGFKNRNKIVEVIDR